MVEVTVNVAVPDRPILGGLIVAVNPLEAKTVRKTALLNPFTPCRLIVDVPDPPVAKLRLDGFAAMVKSGWLEEMMSRMVTE